MPPPRFRLRTLMIAVAVVALIMGVATKRERSLRFKLLAASHAAKEANFESLLRAMVTRNPLEERFHATADYLPQVIEYERILKKKYEHAATHPWVTVQPDPPRPYMLTLP